MPPQGSGPSRPQGGAQGKVTLPSRHVTVCNAKGLHARAAARCVKLLETFDATVTVRHGDMAVAGDSILDLMLLAASPGTKLELSADGPQAEAALSALADLVTRGFDEN